jgi:hypothetical protein
MDIWGDYTAKRRAKEGFLPEARDLIWGNYMRNSIMAVIKNKI